MIVKTSYDSGYRRTISADESSSQAYMEDMASWLCEGRMPHYGDFNSEIIASALQNLGNPGEFSFLMEMNEWNRWDWLDSCFHKFILLRHKGYGGAQDTKTVVEAIRVVRKWRKENKAAHSSDTLGCSEDELENEG